MGQFPSLDQGHFDAIRQHLTQGPLLPRLPMYVAVVLVAPIAEELIFRGALWSLIEEAAGSWWSLILTSLLFALYHQDPLHIAAVFWTGLFLGWLRLQSGSVWPGVVGHGLNNLLGVGALFVLDEDVETSALIACGALAVTLVGSVLVLMEGRKKRFAGDSGPQGAR